MHRVVNYGSALQAYALQKYIADHISKDVCLIDYDYPNKEHRQFMKSQTTLLSKLKIGMIQVVGTFLKNRRNRKSRYKYFYDKYFLLSGRRYHSHDEIMNYPPECDAYITGSDQVWNVNTMNNDGAFYLDFVSAGKFKCSFGASFSIRHIPERYINDIKKYLSSYSMIGLREASGVDLVQSFCLDKRIEVFNTCDPTLLLSKEDYDEIAQDSSVRIKGDYILVYYLAYYNAEPALSEVINQAVEKFKCKVVYIGYRFIPYTGEKQYINGIGPIEFLWIYSHAKFVVSCSFHGTIFSIINRKPFYTIVPADEDDNRSKDLLKVVQLEDRAIPASGSKLSLTFDNPFTEHSLMAIDKYITQSKDFLNKIKTANF